MNLICITQFFSDKSCTKFVYLPGDSVVLSRGWIEISDDLWLWCSVRR